MKKEQAAKAIPTQAELEQWRQKALNLINIKRTMVLATHEDGKPWATPVYYLYANEGFYFYSSAHSRHTRQALSNASAAAAIYADGNSLDQIEGLQMAGDISLVAQPAEKLTVAARYLVKFPLAKSLLGNPGAVRDLPPDTHLYRFDPSRSYYVDNRAGFGRRLEIRL